MRQQRLNINIQMNTYIKAKESGINISKLINQLLTSYFQVSDKVEEAEAELLDEINKTQDIKEKQEEKLRILQIKLQNKRNEIAKEEKELFDQSQAIGDALIRGGFLHD